MGIQSFLSCDERWGPVDSYYIVPLTMLILLSEIWPDPIFDLVCGIISIIYLLRAIGEPYYHPSNKFRIGYVIGYYGLGVMSTLLLVFLFPLSEQGYSHAGGEFGFYLATLMIAMVVAYPGKWRNDARRRSK